MKSKNQGRGILNKQRNQQAHTLYPNDDGAKPGDGDSKGAGDHSGNLWTSTDLRGEQWCEWQCYYIFCPQKNIVICGHSLQVILLDLISIATYYVSRFRIVHTCFLVIPLYT